MTLNVVVVRLIDREVQGSDAVASIGAFDGIMVNTGSGQSLVVELVEVILLLADRGADGVIQRFVNDELQGIEGSYTVHYRRVVSVDTRRVEESFISAPFMNPGVRQFALTDGNHCIYLRMNGEEQFCDRVATVIGRTVVTEGTRSGVRLTVEHIGLTFVDISRDTYVDGLVDRQDQGDDTVAAVSGYECVGIGTAFGITNAVEQVVRTFAHRMANGIVDHRYDAYVAYVGAIIQVMCLEAFDIGTGLVDALLEYLCLIRVIPSVRRLVVADGNGIFE